MRKLLPLVVVLALLPFAARAQMDSDFSIGGAVRIGASTTTCNAAATGAIRYNSASSGSIDFCNGTAWANGGAAGGSIDGLSDGRTMYASGNIFVGHEAPALSTGYDNTALGNQALDSVTTGFRNTALGSGALTTITGSWGNTALGYEAMNGATGDTNVAVGVFALGIGSQDGGGNVGVGSSSLYFNTGANNVGVGANALNQNRAKAGSTAVGWEAMRYADSTTTAGDSYNTALGHQALRGSATPASNTGIRNTALGHSVLMDNTSGNENTAVGYASMLTNTTGSFNTAIGESSMRFNTTGNNNTGIGYDALAFVTTGGDSNTALGYMAGDNITTGDNNLIIGYNIDAPSATGNNQMNIGDTIYGDLATDFITIGTTAGQVRALPPTAETIGAGATVTANACGTVKRITATAARTTSTANTFTAPAAANAGCCMDVVNTGANNITLDANASFRTIGAADQVVGQYDAVRVCSDGAGWYQVSAVAGNQ